MNMLHTKQTISSPPINSTTLIPSQTPQNQIHFPKMKPILQKAVTFRCKMPSSLAYITKYQPKMLSNVELVSLQSNQPNFKTIRIICQSLKVAKSVSSLIIRKDDSNSQNLKQLKHLLNKTHSHWKKLVVSFINYAEEEKSFHPSTLPRLRKCHNLSSLDISFYCTEYLKNHILPCLLQQLKGLQNLQIFKLDISDCKNREEIPKDYEPNAPIFTFRFPRSLESIRISFQKSSLMSSKLLNLFASNLSRCHFLRYLNLNCNKIPSAHKSSILASLFEKKQSIKYLRIAKVFSEVEHIQESQIFTQDFQYMKHLLALDLRIIFKLPEDSSKVFTRNLFEHLASLQNLKFLKLELHVQKYSSDPDYQNFLLCLQSLRHLEKLILILEGQADRSTTHLQSLPQAFQSLSCLTSLRLLLYDHKISHTDVISLSLIYLKISLLFVLWLWF